MSVAEIEAGSSSSSRRAGTLWRDALYRSSGTGAIVGFVLVAAFVFVAIFAPWLAPYHPLDRTSTPSPPVPPWPLERALARPGRPRPRRAVALIYGARYSLLICVVAVTVGLSAGLLLGALAGYFRRTDGLIMRVMDVMLAIPGFLMAIGIVALFGGGGWSR